MNKKIGRVIKVIAGFYDVETENKEIIRLRGSGKLRNDNLSPVVGDFVEYDELGFVIKVKERNNVFVRPKIANIDQVIIVMSVKEPNFSSLLLDKFLMIVESKNIKPVLAITKIDLDSNYKEVLKDYINLNYEIHFIDNHNKKEVNTEFFGLFKDKVSVFMGQTGVGKTSLINLLSENQFETQSISKSLNRGKHTTRVVQMIDWNQGKLIDTPGFSSFEIELNKDQIATAFKIFKLNANLCKFRSCFHYKEEEKYCKIKLMVKNGEIPLTRYENYLYFLKDFLGEKNEIN
ncbi:ribosome small subunit-dependent GTPase A [Mycoplasma sp. 1012]